VATEAAQCFVQGSMLYHSWWPQHADATAQTQVQLAIPLELHEAVMFVHHNDLLAGHLGVNWTIDALWCLYWWPGMYTNIEKWVLECMMCQARKNPTEKKKGLMMPMPAVSQCMKEAGECSKQQYDTT
jgi:hypothetical protein